MPTRSFTLLLIAGLLSAAIGQAPPTSQASPAREQRRQTYLELSKKIFAGAQAPDAVRRAVNNLPPAQVTGITEQLHDLSVAEIEDVLGGPKPSAQNVIDALKTILGETALAGWGAQFTNTPFAEFIELGGARAVAVSYGILRGGGALPNSHPYLEFYVPQNAKWRLQASADLDFDGRTFFVSPVDAGVPGQAWFLAWGRMCGDTGGDLNVRLYAFDGREVRMMWQRDDLIWGAVTVSHGSATLEYDKEYHSAERVRETLYVTPNGLK